MLRRVAAGAAVLACCAFAGLPNGAVAFARRAVAPVPHVAPGSGTPSSGTDSGAARPGFGLRIAEIVLRNAGRRVARVRADSVSVSPDMRYATLSPRVEAEVYQDGRVSLRLRCDEMVIDRETNDLVMRGRMEVTANDGDHAAAPEARWDAAARQLTFPGGLRVAARGSTLVAAQATARAGLRALDLTGGVTVTFPISGVRP